MASPDEAHAHAHAELVHAFPAVPLRIITSVLTAYEEVMPTIADAARAARERIADARSMTSSSIGSHVDGDLTSVAIYLAHHDVDRLHRGLPIDLQALDHNGGTLSVHIRRERRRRRRTPVHDTNSIAPGTPGG